MLNACNHFTVCIFAVNVVSCHVLYFVFQCTPCKIYCVVDSTVCVCKVALFDENSGSFCQLNALQLLSKNTHPFDHSLVVSYFAFFIIQFFPNILPHNSPEFHFSMPSYCILIGICFAVDVLKPGIKSRWFQHLPVC